MHRGIFPLIFILLLSIALGTNSFAQIIINEVCLKNGNGIIDEDGKNTDWIELYNTSDNPVNIKGFSISDTKHNFFFDDININAKEFLLVFASGKNRYTPNLHANFKLAPGEELIFLNAQGVELEKIILPDMHLDHSYGCLTDGASTKVFFKQSTPKESNNNQLNYLGYCNNPTFSSEAGFYETAFELSISNYEDGIIYYTTNGNEPDTNAFKYSKPIIIDKTVVIRSVVIGKSNLLPSSVITNSYFINYQSNIPVISISSNPDNFWDWEKGICVKGPNAELQYPYHNANFWKEIEIPIHMEYFDKNNKLGFEQDFGCKIHGGTQNRTKPMKSFRILAKKKYGNSKLHYKLFDDKPIEEFDRFVLRNASFDFNRAYMRDALAHKISLMGNLNVDALDYRPAVVFINGEFYGVEDIRERIDKHYITNNYPLVNKDNIDLLKEDTIVVEGDSKAFDAMFNFIINNDLSQKQNADSVAKMLDVYSMFDYFILETALENSDWPQNNIKLWRERKEGSLFRYVLFDLDASFATPWSTYDIDNLGRLMGNFGNDIKHVIIFRALLSNPDWKNYFINRYADLLNTTLSVENILKMQKQLKEVIDPKMPEQFVKWSYSNDAWENELNNKLIPFIDNRTKYNFDFVQSNFNLKKQTTLSFEVFPNDAGAVIVNSLENLSMPWTGNYFDGNEIQIQAKTKIGYVFKYWKRKSKEGESYFENNLTFNPDTNETITAYFINESNNTSFEMIPNPTTDKINISFECKAITSGDIIFINPLGQEQKIFTLNTVGQGYNFFEINLSDLNSGVYHVKLRLKEKEEVRKLVVLKNL